MKKDKYEDAAERLLINGQYKLINKNVKWMSHSLRDALSTTDFRKYYDNNLVS